MQYGRKAVWSIGYVSVASFFPSLKQNFIAYRSSKVSSRPDFIFEIHHLWQSGFSRVYPNCCCSCSFEAEIIKIGPSSHKIYSNNIVNFQKSTKILNACTNSLNTPRNFCISALFWVFTRLLCSEEMSSWTIREQSHLPNKALKFTRHFRWLIRPKSVFLYCWFRWCRIVSSRRGVRPLNLINYVSAASGCMKERLISTIVEAEVNSNFSFAQGRSIFPAMRRAIFLSGVSGTYFILFIFFFFFLSAIELRTLLIHVYKSNISNIYE